MTYPAATPHSLPEQIAEDVYVVYGSIRINPVISFTRNMVIVKSGEELTLVNPVRMNDEGLGALDKLGNVRHVLRLGPLHGIDDPFYVDRYDAKMWALPGGTTYTTPAVDQELAEGGELPFPYANLFVFQHMTEPEGALLLQRKTNILLTTDSIQSYATPPHKPHSTILARLLLPIMGFPNKTIIGPIWMKLLVTDQDGMREEFRRLLNLDFDQLLSAHGTFLSKGAKAEIAAAFEKIFGEKP